MTRQAVIVVEKTVADEDRDLRIVRPEARDRGPGLRQPGSGRQRHVCGRQRDR